MLLVYWLTRLGIEFFGGQCGLGRIYSSYVWSDCVKTQPTTIPTHDVVVVRIIVFCGRMYLRLETGGLDK